MVQQPSDDNSDEEQKEPPNNPAGALPLQIPDIYGIPILKDDGTISFSAMINIIGKFLKSLFKLLKPFSMKLFDENSLSILNHLIIID